MNGRTVRSAAKGRSLTSGSLEDGLVARPVLQFINEGVLPHVLLRGVYPLLSLQEQYHCNLSGPSRKRQYQYSGTCIMSTSLRLCVKYVLQTIFSASGIILTSHLVASRFSDKNWIAT